MKICPVCKIEKCFDEFHRQNERGILSGYCKSCNKIKCKEYSKKRKIKDPEFMNNERERARLNRQNSISYRLVQMVHSIKSSAAKRKISFNIEKFQIELMMLHQDFKCIKTGMKFDFTQGKGTKPFGPTIDRIDCSRGYEPDNIQLVCNMYNYAKNRWSDEEVLTFAKKLVENQKIDHQGLTVL